MKLFQESFPCNILFCVEGITDFSRWHNCNGATTKTKHSQKNYLKKIIIPFTRNEQLTSQGYTIR